MNILKQRLDKIISSQFNLTRSIARTVIRRGKVSVNGEIIRDAGMLIEPDKCSIVYGDEELEYKKYVYLIMNKPKGVLSASEDKNRKTVVDLVPENLKRNGLFPVGRLDKDTTGLLLITDDGEFAHNVISPKKMVNKTYIAELDGEVNEEMCLAFAKGVILADGTQCRPAVLKNLGDCKAEITIYEGKYHQIKRMFGTVGLGVNGLHRKSLGGLNLPDDLAEGECRALNNDQLKSVFLEK